MMPESMATVRAGIIMLHVGWGVFGVRRFMASMGVRRIAPSRFVNAVLVHGDVWVPYQPLSVLLVSDRSVETAMRIIPVVEFCVGGFVVAMSIVAVSPRVMGMSIFMVTGWWLVSLLSRRLSIGVSAPTIVARATLTVDSESTSVMRDAISIMLASMSLRLSVLNDVIQ